MMLGGGRVKMIAIVIYEPHITYNFPLRTLAMILLFVSILTVVAHLCSERLENL
jgi:hypothetical protein